MTERVASAEEELERLRLNRDNVQAMLDKVKEEVRELTVTFQIYESKRSNLVFTFEKIWSRKKSVFWWLIIVSAPLLMLHSYAHEVPVFCFLNAYAFLVNWKSLYQREVPWAQVIAFIIIAATIKFV